MNPTFRALVALAFLGTSTSAAVLQNDAIVEGKTIGEWSAEWWKWLLPISTNNNPMLDTTGAFAGIDQPGGSVFFLGYGLGLVSPPVVRRLTVTEDKYLFFPIETFENDNVDHCPPCFSIDELRQEAANVVSSATGLHAQIDGIEITNILEHRAISPVFNLFYTNADNIHSYAFKHPVSGLIDPMIVDGYWLMVEPLSPGDHVVQFGGRLPGFFFPVEVIDYITVQPLALPNRVEQLIATLNDSNLPAKWLPSLLGSLKATRASFEAENLRAGINQLHAFQYKLRAQVTRGNQGTADELIAAAQLIIDKAMGQLDAGADVSRL